MLNCYSFFFYRIFLLPRKYLVWGFITANPGQVKPVPYILFILTLLFSTNFLYSNSETHRKCWVAKLVQTKRLHEVLKTYKYCRSEITNSGEMKWKRNECGSKEKTKCAGINDQLRSYNVDIKRRNCNQSALDWARISANKMGLRFEWQIQANGWWNIAQCLDMIRINYKYSFGINRCADRSKD